MNPKNFQSQRKIDDILIFDTRKVNFIKKKKIDQLKY